MTIPSQRSLIFEVKSTGSELAFIRVLRLGLDNFAIGRLRKSSKVFGLLWKTSDFFGNLRKLSCRLQKSQHSQDKNLTLISQKKLAGILLGSFFVGEELCLTRQKRLSGSFISWQGFVEKTKPSLIFLSRCWRVGVQFLDVTDDASTKMACTRWNEKTMNNSSMITANQQYSFNNTKKHLGKVASDLT